MEKVKNFSTLNDVLNEDRWKDVATHSDTEIKGFFGDYRFLSNFWPARVLLDGEEYNFVESAYQAAKYKKEFRGYFKKCSPREAVVFSRNSTEGKYSSEEWFNMNLEVMKKLLIHKFDKSLNQENYKKLMETGNKYLEETNYWGDKYWGVTKLNASEDGVGENNLGRLLMEIRDNLRKITIDSDNRD